MGIICTRDSSVEAKDIEFSPKPRAKTNKIREEEIKTRKTLIFSKTITEHSFVSLSNPRYGTHIKWKRGNLIGKGSYAEVYQCLNLKSGELMAVKHFTLSDDPEKIQKVFLNMTKEVALLKQLSHPNIVKYYQTDLAEDMKSIDVLLEYVHGGSLISILEKYGALELEVIKKYSKQLLSGLHYLHENNIAHRDLKSGNILVCQNAVAKLSDFGSSRKFEDKDNGMSRSVRGSPYWIAPEVVKKTGHGLSADIWSFGCVLIEMATGRPPWSNYTNETSKVLAMIVKDGSLPDIPDFDYDLKDVIEKCLRRTPESRPTCSELWQMNFFSDDSSIN